MRVKNWKRFQHYQNRKPGAKFSWIKLYLDLLEDPEWFKLDGPTSKILVMLWLIASDDEGTLPSIDKITFRLRITEAELSIALSTLGHWIEGISRPPIEEPYSPPRQEKIREEEKREEKKDNSKDSPAKSAGGEQILVLQNGSIPPEKKPTTPQAEFVERFKVSYETMTGQPYKFKREHFVIAAKLINEYGIEQVVAKTKILGAMCRAKSTWFSKGGWSDFSIEKLSSQWNAILVEAHQESPTDKAAREKSEIEKKVRDTHERLNQAMGRR